MTENHSFFENGYVIEEKINGIPALNKEIDVDTIHGNINLNTIEINSKVDSGNSGGPLLNSKKEVIGVVSVKKEDNAIAYAMPINYVMEIIDKLEDI